MEQDLHRALEPAQHPTIDFCFQHLDHAEIERDQDRAGLKLRMAGQLSMTGTRRPVTMDVMVYRDSSRNFHARAQGALLMSDFGVTPPSAFFGLIRAHDQADVIFDRIFVRATQAPSTHP